MTLPNFFIVGAPKCGTTAIADYLRAHPRVFMCTPKEPHYFALDLPAYRHVEEWGKYQSLFRAAGDGCRAVGEASVFYLYSDVAASGIHARLPAARMLVMLRNPLDIAVSMHAQALQSRDECVVDFAHAWALCKQRRAGQVLPRHCRDGKVLLYNQLPLLGAQLQRLLRIVPRAQVRWWFYEDFKQNPGDVYREILTFLELPDDGRQEFPAVNPRRFARSQLLAQFTQKTPAALLDVAMRVKQGLGIRRLGVMDALRRVNFVPARQQELPPPLHDEMRSHFAPDIRLLESITERSLDHWLEVAA